MNSDSNQTPPDEESDRINPENISKLLAMSNSPPSVSGLLEELPDIKRQLKPFHPAKTALSIAGLLTEPTLHANSLRLELLIHLILSCSKGQRTPDVKQIHTWLNKVLGESQVVSLEDPAEDVFISNITTKCGNFRLFEGTWEHNDFYLQRVLGAISTLPDDQDGRELSKQITGALKISEEIAQRRRLPRFTSGSGQETGAIRVPPANRLKVLNQSVRFTKKDFERLGISADDLSPFVLKKDNWARMAEEAIQYSSLQRHPIIRDGKNWYLLLPSAISIALRHHVFEWIVAHGYEDNFDQHFVGGYINLFQEMPILGFSIPKDLPMAPNRVDDWILFDFARQVDEGRYVHIITVVDSLKGYTRHGLMEIGHTPLDLGGIVEKRVSKTRSEFIARSGFKEGLTLVVGCGYGRPLSIAIPNQPDGWHVEFISAADIQTFAWLPSREELILWKLIKYEQILHENGISIFNHNGLLNLYGWWKDTDYLMIPPELEFGDEGIDVVIPIDCLKNVRHDVRKGWDVHSLPLPTGEYVEVRRVSAISYFNEDNHERRYFAIEAFREGQLLGACVGKGVWWIRGESDRSKLSRDAVFKLWDAAFNWLEKSITVIEKQSSGLADMSLLIVLDMNELHEEKSQSIDEIDAYSCLSVFANAEDLTIRIKIRDPFIGAFAQPENVGESAIVRAIVQGAFSLENTADYMDTLDSVVQKIIPNKDARYFHVFEAKQFHEYIQHLDRPKSLIIEDCDAGVSKLGLGWLAQKDRTKRHFSDVDDSVHFLNDVVDCLWRRMRLLLKRFNRIFLIERLLRHIEGNEIERRIWSRTFRAMLALRANDASTNEVAVQQIARYSAAGIASRIVIEMALCECPLDQGETPGVLDLIQLISDAMFMYQLGGSSDAIRKRVMNPEVEIAPCGDVLTDVGFRYEIAERLAHRFESVRLSNAASHYTEQYTPFESAPDVEGSYPPEFLDAFKEELGVSINELRWVRDGLGDLAESREKCVFVSYKNELLDYFQKAENVSAETAGAVLERFSLWPRSAWDETPKGYLNKDWWPWRFGRRLSLVARPLVRLEDCKNPRFVVSPGLFADSVPYIFRRYYEAEIQRTECKSERMRKWIDGKTNRSGHEFVQQVSERMAKLGFETLIEKEMGALLGERMEKDLGDVDVLAWRSDLREVFVIECKALRLAKTPNEMAEQLTRFSGQRLSSGKPDELLKHLNRCELLDSRNSQLAKTLGLKSEMLAIRPVVCFSKPVPMQYVSDRLPQVLFVTFDELEARIGATSR